VSHQAQSRRDQGTTALILGFLGFVWFGWGQANASRACGCRWPWGGVLALAGTASAA
jgi:hypothetical protein